MGMGGGDQREAEGERRQRGHTVLHVRAEDESGREARNKAHPLCPHQNSEYGMQMCRETEKGRENKRLVHTHGCVFEVCGGGEAKPRGGKKPGGPLNCRHDGDD